MNPASLSRSSIRVFDYVFHILHCDALLAFVGGVIEVDRTDE